MIGKLNLESSGVFERNYADMDFSILVTGFNDGKRYADFFESIKKQTLLPSELIIADGGSSDNSKEIVEDLIPNYLFKIRFIDAEDRLNIAQGYNVAVKACKTNLMLMMGIGNDYSDNFCESMIKYYYNNDVDIVYTPIVGINVNTFSKAFNIAFVGGKKGKDFGYASNRGALLSKKVFDKIGYFYEGFVYAGEDTEFFIRAERAGLNAGYNLNGIVYWETPNSFKQYLKKNRVNAIADMQCEPNSQILKHITIRAGLIAATVVCSLVSPWIGIGLWAVVVCAIVWKIRSINIIAILLRLHFIFLPTYYYMKNRKYFSEQYKVKLEEEV